MECGHNLLGGECKNILEQNNALWEQNKFFPSPKVIMAGKNYIFGRKISFILLLHIWYKSLRPMYKDIGFGYNYMRLGV